MLVRIRRLQKRKLLLVLLERRFLVLVLLSFIILSPNLWVTKTPCMVLILVTDRLMGIEVKL